MKFKEYLVMVENNGIINICIQQDCDRPNNMDDDELIAQYMEHNYYGSKYELLTNAIEPIFIDENYMWGIVEEPTELDKIIENIMNNSNK